MNTIERGVHSLNHLMHLVMERHFTCGSSYKIARVLASMYNGDRVQADLYELAGLDDYLIEHLINVLRLHCAGAGEIHTHLTDYSSDQPWPERRIEKMIEAYGLELRRRDPLGYDQVRELQKIAAAFPVERFTARQAYHAITGAPRQQFPRAEEVEGLRQTLLRFQQEGLIESAEGPRGGAGYRLTLLGQCCVPAAEKTA